MTDVQSKYSNLVPHWGQLPVYNDIVLLSHGHKINLSVHETLSGLF